MGYMTDTALGSKAMVHLNVTTAISPKKKKRQIHSSFHFLLHKTSEALSPGMLPWVALEGGRKAKPAQLGLCLGN